MLSNFLSDLGEYFEFLKQEKRCQTMTPKEYGMKLAKRKNKRKVKRNNE